LIDLSYYKSIPTIHPELTNIKAIAPTLRNATCQILREPDSLV